ncbi:MAG: hypothetical protein PF448_11015 [Bacteroidales bacterium]|jgi:hypothetical protein|nr:hypothetical protein [Bacteroidales bacterium]
MKSIYWFLFAVLFGILSLESSAQWKINEGFDTKIPSEWSGNLGNQGWTYTATVSSLSGVAKGQTEPISTPDCVSLNYPQDNATEVGLYPYFQWTQSNLSANYKICLGTNYPPSNLLDSVSTGLDSIYSLTAQLNPNETYYWQIIAENSLGQSSGCDIFSFTTQADLYPYAVDFENPNAVLPGGWTVLNGSTTTESNEWHTGYTDARNGNAGSNGFFSISLNVTDPKDSYFISPALPMNNDNLYKISFYYNALAQGAYERLEVKYGTENSIAGQILQISPKF